MDTVRDLLRNKGGQVFAVQPEDTVLAAMRLMVEKNCGAVLVMQGTALVGILSERDVVRKVEVQGRTPQNTLVREIMTEKLYIVHPTSTVTEIMQLMSGRRIRHLPVTENDRVVGVISIGDVVKAIITEQAFTIEQLENYIQGVR